MVHEPKLVFKVESVKELINGKAEGQIQIIVSLRCLSFNLKKYLGERPRNTLTVDFPGYSSTVRKHNNLN